MIAPCPGLDRLVAAALDADLDTAVGHSTVRRKIAMFSDGGAEAERGYSYDESVDGSYYTRRIKAARRRLSRNCPELVEVFNLVVKNGKNRLESIAELALRHHVENEVAKMRYWGHLKKISFFFKAQ